MRQMAVWFFLSCKRCLKKASFVALLLALPAAAFAMRQVEKKEGQEARIAVWVEESPLGRDGELPLEWQLAESLVQHDSSGGLFRFYLCGSQDQLKAHVASRQAECGYTFPAGLREKLDHKDYRRCIQVYSAPSTVLAQLSTEVVSAALMELYDREIFVDYITQSELVRQAAWDQRRELEGQRPDPAGIVEMLEITAGELYDKWQNNGSTFRFEYGYRDMRGEGDGKEQAPAIFPVRGMAAVYLFLTGLYSGVVLGSDQARGLFRPLSPKRRRACGLAVMAAPVFLGAVSCLWALMAGGCVDNIWREIGIMALYFGAVCIFSWGAKALCPRPQVLCCLIPLFLVGSLLFTPVILDIRQFFPELGWVEKLFLPSYYLRAF